METIQTYNENVLNTYKRYPVVFSKGKGVWLFDENGDKYLDMCAGIAVSGLGHSHPAIVKAIRKQAGKLIHTSNLYYNEVNGELAAKLTAITGYSKVFFCNSGAEANEAAIKLARKFGKLTLGEKKHKIISMSNSFHGRTIATITATGQPKYQKDFTPLLGGFTYAEYNNIETIEKLVDNETAAIIVEPVQGEGGVHPADFEFIKKLRELCDKYNALLIFDEIQTGVGRTGTMFCYEQYAPVKPDLFTAAKAIAGGLPMGVLFVSEKLKDILQPGDHASTFGGNLVCSAAAIAVLDTIQKDKILSNVIKSSKYIFEKLNNMKKEFPVIKDIRGLGLLIGMETDIPAPDLVNELLTKKIVTVPAGANVVRFIPPLIISTKEIDFMLNGLREILVKRK